MAAQNSPETPLDKVSNTYTLKVLPYVSVTHMIYTSAITSKGQVLIPKRLRDAMKLVPRQRVTVSEREEGGKMFVVIERAHDIMSLAGRFKAPKGKNALKAREYMEKQYGHR